MGAAREEFLRRTLVAGVASTVVLSLTALTAGVAPAIADPSSAETTTVEVPEPEAVDEQPTVESTAERSAETTVEVTTPVVTQSAEPETTPTAEPAAEPTAEAVVTEPVVTEPAPSSTTAAPAPRTQAPVTSSTVTPSTVTPSTVTPPTVTSSTVAPPPRTTTAPAPSSASRTSAPAAETTADKPAEAAAETAVEPAATGESATPTESSEPFESEKPSESVESSEVQKTSRVIETLKPDTLAAPAADIELARVAAPVEVKPEPARVDELAQLSRVIELDTVADRLADERAELREERAELREERAELRAEQREWDRRVRQWSPDWVQYDEFYRPMIVNPYRDPVRIVYEYENRPRVVTIPPLQRMVMYVADLAAYSFTAVVLNTVNTVVSTAVSVAVGSFFGGGFIPTVGAIAPPPPPPLYRYDNVPVQVRYSDAVYEPFRVQRIVDVGDDARYGERRVLLDGVTPAWGVWKQSASGERLFEVHRTQQYPGLDEPREVPLPGDYRLRLAAEQVPEAPVGDNQDVLITAAVACAVLSLGAVGGAALLGRRRT